MPKGRRPDVPKRVAERVAQTFRSFAKQQGLSIPDAGERLGMNRDAAYDLAGRSAPGAKPAAIRPPELEHVRKLARHANVSADWLLGFDVSADRSAREPIGALAEELRRALLEAKPRGAPEDELQRDESGREYAPGRASTELVATVTQAWWAQRGRGRAALWADRLLRLAGLVRQAATLPRFASAAAAMRLQSDRAMRRAAELRSADAIDWEKLADDVYPSVMVFSAWERDADRLAAYANGGTPVTSFGAAGHWYGFAYHGAREDHAWFLNAESGEPEYRRGKFLKILRGVEWRMYLLGRASPPE